MATPVTPSTIGGERWGAAQQGNEQKKPTVINGPDEHGYRPVDLTLKRLHHEGGLWHLGASPLEYVEGKDRQAEVVLEAKMVLDDSLPRRNRFWAAPHYDGCVDKHERLHKVHWVRVELPEGESVQVSDKRLYIQGRVGRTGDDGRVTFEATAVMLQHAAVQQHGHH